MYQTGAPWSWGQFNAVESQIIATARSCTGTHSGETRAGLLSDGTQHAECGPSTRLNATDQLGAMGRSATNNPFPLKGIAAGQFDSYIDGWATGLAAYGHPVMLRWGPEMQGNWLPWGANINGNTPADFIAAYRHIDDRFARAGARNVQWVFGADGDPNGGFPPSDCFTQSTPTWIGWAPHLQCRTTQQDGTWKPMSARLSSPQSPSRTDPHQADHPCRIRQRRTGRQKPLGFSKPPWTFLASSREYAPLSGLAKASTTDNLDKRDRRGARGLRGRAFLPHTARLETVVGTARGSQG